MFKTQTWRAPALVCLCAWLLLSTAAAQAQVKIYNEERDKQAQAAEKLVETIKNGALFDKQLKNLTALAQKDFETEFLLLKLHVNAAPLSVLTWKDSLQLVAGAENRNTGKDLFVVRPRQLQTSLDELQKAIAAAKLELENLKTETKSLKPGQLETDPTIKAFFERLGDFSDLVELAEQIGKPTSLGTFNFSLLSAEDAEALGQIKDVADALGSVYQVYATQIKAYNQEMEKLDEIRLALKKVALQSLQVDEEHWKKVAAIRARRQAERGQITSLITAYSGYASRLRLLSNFDQRTIRCPLPASCDLVLQTRRAFIQAINQASPADATAPRRSQSISESLKELTARTQALDKFNQEILSLANDAMVKTLESKPLAEIIAAVDLVKTKLNQASDSIVSNNLVHQTEEVLKQQWKEAARELNALPPGNSPEEALRKVVVAGNDNVIKLRDTAMDAPLALLNLGAIIARADTPSRLADLRLAQEAHAYSIRKSAVRARAYELTVGAGVKRLALYHKSGIKPERLAQFIHALSTAAIPPAILAK